MASLKSAVGCTARPRGVGLFHGIGVELYTLPTAPRQVLVHRVWGIGDGLPVGLIARLGLSEIWSEIWRLPGNIFPS